MKRKFKQRWLTIPPISRKRTNISHLKALTHKNITSLEINVLT